MPKKDFQPIFDYIDQSKKEILAQVAGKKELANLQNSLDAYAKQTKDYYQEVTVVIAKANRMEMWIKEAAKKIGLEYKV